MWILDERTLLTSFPRLWGANDLELSDVHRSLRDRLATGDEIVSSVFDLASLIIDQCSCVFFDRTKPRDNRPDVVNIFRDTIASLVSYFVPTPMRLVSIN